MYVVPPAYEAVLQPSLAERVSSIGGIAATEALPPDADVEGLDSLQAEDDDYFTALRAGDEVSIEDALNQVLDTSLRLEDAQQ